MTTATSGTTSPLTSPLHDRHVALGAKMADFGGWDMPIEYPGGGVVAEHTAVRERVGVFDVSHLGKASVTGPGAADFVNACLTNDVRRIQPGSAQYTLCCDESGGVVDDLIVYLKSDDDVFLIPNAANTAEVVRRLQAAAPEGITVTNLHRDYGVIAVQGTKSDEVLESLGLPTGHDYMSFVEADWQGVRVIVCRTGYTGERGYELVPRWDDAPALWDALVEAVAPFDGKPCGLGARDTLRTEMGYPLHGQDLSLQISPVQARAGWAVGWKKETFWGKARARGRAGQPDAPHARPARDRSRHPARALHRVVPGRRGGRGHLGHVLAHPQAGHRARAPQPRDRRRRDRVDRRARSRPRGDGRQAALRPGPGPRELTSRPRWRMPGGCPDAATRQPSRGHV